MPWRAKSILLQPIATKCNLTDEHTRNQKGGTNRLLRVCGWVEISMTPCEEALFSDVGRSERMISSESPTSGQDFVHHVGGGG